MSEKTPYAEKRVFDEKVKQAEKLGSNAHDPKGHIQIQRDDNEVDSESEAGKQTSFAKRATNAYMKSVDPIEDYLKGKN